MSAHHQCWGCRELPDVRRCRRNRGSREAADCLLNVEIAGPRSPPGNAIPFESAYGASTFPGMAGTRRSASRFAQSITKITHKKFERILVTQAIEKWDLTRTPTINQKLWNYCNNKSMSGGGGGERRAGRRGRGGGAGGAAGASGAT